jgi:hypothetical protein
MCYYLPLLQTWLLPEQSQKQMWLQLWQLFPITHSIAQLTISKFWKDTVGQDKIERPKRDVRVIGYTVGVPAVVAALVWLYTLFTSSTSLLQSLSPQQNLDSLINFTNLPSSTSNFIIAIATTYLWLLYFIWDAKVAGMITHDWVTVLAAMAVGSVVLGPGGAVGAAFLWREWVITERRHKGALTVERVRKMEKT